MGEGASITLLCEDWYVILHFSALNNANLRKFSCSCKCMRMMDFLSCGFQFLRNGTKNKKEVIIVL